MLVSGTAPCQSHGVALTALEAEDWTGNNFIEHDTFLSHVKGAQPSKQQQAIEQAGDLLGFANRNRSAKAKSIYVWAKKDVECGGRGAKEY